MNGKNQGSRRERGGGRGPVRPSFVLSDAQVDGIVERNLATVVEAADKLAQAAAKVSKARVRDIYATVLRLRAQWEARASSQGIANLLHMLRPRVAYLKARERGAREREEAAAALVDAIEKLVPAVGKAATPAAIDAFFDFFEAFVAYHRGYAKN